LLVDIIAHISVTIRYNIQIVEEALKLRKFANDVSRSNDLAECLQIID